MCCLSLCTGGHGIGERGGRGGGGGGFTACGVFRSTCVSHVCLVPETSAGENKLSNLEQHTELMAPVLGYRTTAVQALRGVDLTGKTAVITGATHACASACKF